MADEPKRNDGAKPNESPKTRIEPDQPTPNRDKRRQPPTLDLKAEPEKPAEPPKAPAPGGPTATIPKPTGPAPGAAAKNDAAKSDVAKSDAGKPAATTTTPPTIDTAKVEPPKPQSDSAAAIASGIKPDPAKPEPAKPEPAKPEPAKPEPAKPEPVKPSVGTPPPKTEQAKTAAADPKATISARPSAPPPKPAPPSAAARSGGLAVPILASAVTAAIVAAGVAYGWQAYTAQDQTIAALKEQVSGLQGRLDAVDKQTAGLAPAASVTALRTDLDQKITAANAARSQAAQASEQRLRKLEIDRAETSGRLEKRVGMLEALTTNLGAQIDQANTKAEVVRIQAARAVEAVAKASATPPGAPIVLPPTVDVAPLKARLDELEAKLKGVQETLAKPKTEARATEVRAVVVSPKADPANLAIAAQALERAFDAGAPYQSELATVEALGAGDRAAALKPFAEKGAPSFASLNAQFAALRPKILAAAAPPSSGGFLDRLGQGASSVISVRPTGENAAAGTSPAALVGQIDAALARGDAAGALAAWSKLPPSAQKVSQAWADDLKARAAAHKAAQALATESVAALAKPKS